MKKLSFIAPVIAWLALAACQNYPFSAVHVTTDVETFNRLKVPEGSQVDILFVIDNSGSMKDKQDRLRANMAAFIQEVSASQTGFHLGIVTTDVFAATDGGRLRVAGDGPHFWTSPDSGDPNASVKRQQIVDAFNATVASLGTAGNWNEAGLRAAYQALNPNDPNVAAFNQGFLRDSADLAVIVVSDEDDCSFKEAYDFEVSVSWTNSTCYTRTDALYAPEDYVNQFASLKHGIGKFRAALVGGGLHLADGSFAPRGCITTASGQAADTCGCWLYYQGESEAPDAPGDPNGSRYFCPTLHDNYGQPCIELDACVGTDLCPSVAGGACDTPRCVTTASQRYERFLTQLGSSRTAAGWPAGTYADSICDGDYHDALVSIAKTVVSSDCVQALGAAASPQDVKLTLTRTTNGQTKSEVLPRFDAQDPTAACHDCSQCPNGAWTFTAPSTLCLACGLHKNAGDELDASLFVSPK